jgi:putative membrane protein
MMTQRLAATTPSSGTPAEPRAVHPAIIIRGILGGTLMGLANLVPGISGGTMLVVTGIFTRFIAAIAEVTSLRLSRAAIITLLSVVVPAGLAVLLLAGAVRNLVIDHRWVMYSLFIGWTLGGVPAVWQMATDQPAYGSPRRFPARRVWAGVAIGLAIMVLMVLVQDGGSAAAPGAGGPSPLRLLAGGMVAAAAMVLPGVSGGYLLLLLGLYVPILDAVDQVKTSLQARDVNAMVSVLGVVVPLGIGVVVGIVGVSHILRWLLRRYEKITMGVLLGLLLGAFLGLYPFQRPVEPPPGAVIKGQIVTAQALEAGSLKAKDWPVEYFTPSPGQVALSVLLIAAAAASTLVISRLGRDGQVRG